LFGSTPEGLRDLRGFGGRLERMPEEDRNALFGAGHQPLRDLAADYRTVRPFEKAAYTENPEELTSGTGLGPQTAGGLRRVRDVPVRPPGAAGPTMRRIGPEGVGALQRGVATDLLGRTPEGGFNLNLLPGRLENLNEGYRNELFSPEQNQKLTDLGRASRAMDVNYNRSGSGKLVQKIAEIANPAMLLGQYPLGKFMASPGAADWLMKPAAKVNPFFAPAAVTTALAASRQKRAGQ
jgi:hypothetical protein